jgi:FAD/FMN-containing dehydrogenase
MTVAFPDVDFAVSQTVTVKDEAGLRDALASFDAVRLAGTGSAQSRVPPPESEVTVISLAGMQRILRLEADDLTCSVEAGVRREDLDRRLEECGVWLPCAGTGTIGGIFAADEIGPTGPAQPEPRSLLLGMTAMLAEGKRFRSGARVVKNVAGFDLQKLFVGSRGRLFAATELHLKLRPRPPGILHFRNADLAPDEALALAGRLRRHATRPAALVVRGRESLSVAGTLIGRPGHLDRLAQEFGLQRTPDAPAVGADREVVGGHETLRGQIRFRRFGDLLAATPTSAACCFAGERFEVTLPRDGVDELMARLPECGAAGEIVSGAPKRRGTRTPGDPRSDDLAARLKRALDPKDVLR